MGDLSEVKAKTKGKAPRPKLFAKFKAKAKPKVTSAAAKATGKAPPEGAAPPAGEEEQRDGTVRTPSRCFLERLCEWLWTGMTPGRGMKVR